MAKKRQSFFTMDELKNNVFMVEEHERKVFMPNEIFGDLLKRFDGEVKAKSTTHIAYAYTYTWLAHYMYRYCKYYLNDNVTGIDEAMIKQIMGFPAKSDAYTYITKSGGLLEELGYIRKESDKPFDYTTYETAFCNGDDVDIVGLEGFNMESDLENNIGWVKKNNKNRKINFPIKGFERDESMITDNDLYEAEDRTGSFFRVDNTHMIDIDVFMFCMADAELGVQGFYLYSYLLYMCDKHYNSFDCSLGRFVTLTGLGERPVRDQLERLEKRNMITNDHKPWCLDKKDWQTPKSNTYEVLPYNGFHSELLEFNQIPKQIKMSAKRYEEEVGFANDEEDFEKETEENKSNTEKLVGYNYKQDFNTFTQENISYDLPF